jgi:hypothetical protein
VGAHQKIARQVRRGHVSERGERQGNEFSRNKAFEPNVERQERRDRDLEEKNSGNKEPADTNGKVQ